MKVLVLENDDEISEYLQRYLDKNFKKILYVYRASNRLSEEIAECFEKCELLVFQPTLIDSSQYNLMMMLMYDCLKKGKLGIKEVQIFTHNDSIHGELSEVWESKSKYIKEVLGVVKIFTIDTVGLHKEELKLNF